MKSKRLSLVTATAVLLCLTACGEQAASGQRAPSSQTVTQSLTRVEFVQLIEQLSEPSGYFDTDNLISNETSYLHVIGEMEELEVEGGVYVGVGPAQNFSYIAQVRPEIAFIIDIRRDNLLQHLLFKSLFGLSSTRIDYLCLLTATPLPENPQEWSDRPISELVAYVDRTPSTDVAINTTRRAVIERVTESGVALDAEMLATIDRLHQEFTKAGLSLRFQSFNRPPRPDYPTLRQLLLETDRSGEQRNFLAKEEDFQFVKSLEDRNLVVPVVGDLAGQHALSAIGNYVADRDQIISAFYTSNVEFYLVRQGTFPSFAQTVSGLPIDERSVIIRSYFNRGFSGRLPQYVPGYNSTQLLQRIETFVTGYEQGRYRTYWDLISGGD